MGSKIWKNETIWGAYVYNLQTIPFFPKDPQTLFQDSFCPKTENEKNGIFLTKIKNPLWKIGKNATI